jgi:hypothetical protein
MPTTISGILDTVSSSMSVHRTPIAPSILIDILPHIPPSWASVSRLLDALNKQYPLSIFSKVFDVLDDKYGRIMVKLKRVVRKI